METHLVMLDGKWHYDVNKHGNGELAEGKCFNCRAPLKVEVEDPALGRDDKSETAKEQPAAPGKPKAVSEMTKKELYNYAKDLGLKVSWATSKAKIIEIIEAGGNEQPETAGNEQLEAAGNEQPEAAENGE